MKASPIEIPDGLRKAIHFLLGPQQAEPWLAALPATWEQYARQWELQPKEILVGGQMSCCLLCKDMAGKPTVLKIPVDAVSGAAEMAALAAWSDRGGVPRVTHSDPAAGIFAMEYIPAGPDRRSEVDAFVDLLQRLSVAEASQFAFPPLAESVRMRGEWAAERFGTVEYQSERTLLDPALQLAEDLLGSGKESRLVHGDLQLKNILSSTSGALFAIDPLPGLGDPHFDAAFWAVMQPSSSPIADLLDALARAWPDVQPERLHAWARVIAVLEFRPYQIDRRARFEGYLDLVYPNRCRSCLR